MSTTGMPLPQRRHTMWPSPQGVRNFSALASMAATMAAAFACSAGCNVGESTSSACGEFRKWLIRSNSSCEVTHAKCPCERIGCSRPGRQHIQQDGIEAFGSLVLHPVPGALDDMEAAAWIERPDAGLLAVHETPGELVIAAGHAGE